MKELTQIRRKTVLLVDNSNSIFKTNEFIDFSQKIGLTIEKRPTIKFQNFHRMIKQKIGHSIINELDFNHTGNYLSKDTLEELFLFLEEHKPNHFNSIVLQIVAQYNVQV